MHKTLLNHFTVIHPLQSQPTEPIDMQPDSLQGLVSELKYVLCNDKKELLSPRAEAVEQLLKRALH